MLPVHAYAIASTATPTDPESIFPKNQERVRVAKTHVVVRCGSGQWGVAYDFGALVFIDVPEAQRDEIVRALIAKVGSESRPPLVETFSVDVQPGAAPAVFFDRVVLGELDARVVELLSLVIAQSVGMEYYENDVDELVGET